MSSATASGAAGADTGSRKRRRGADAPEQPTLQAPATAGAPPQPNQLEAAALADFGIDVHSSWEPVFRAESAKPYFKELLAFVEGARKRPGAGAVFPPREHVYAALALTPLTDVRVVILGQDPYHGAGQAHGLAFSVRKGVPLPPTLKNILKEAAADLGPGLRGFDAAGRPTHGCLDHWARQGVLLLNAVLTVEAGKANSHAQRGWETLTAALVAAVAAARPAGVVYMLWGLPAQKKAALLDRASNLVLEAPHPSPLSAYRGFLGSRPFSRANEYLRSVGRPPVDWSLDPPPTAPSSSSASSGAATTAPDAAQATPLREPGSLDTLGSLTSAAASGPPR
jgi:uracil-DNA glycosylase